MWFEQFTNQKQVGGCFEEAVFVAVHFGGDFMFGLLLLLLFFVLCGFGFCLWVCVGLCVW